MVSLVKWHDKRMDIKRQSIYAPSLTLPHTDDFRQLYNITEREDGIRSLSPHTNGRLGYIQYHLQACPLDAQYKEAVFPTRAEWVRDNISPEADPADHHSTYMRARRRTSKRNEHMRHAHRLVYEAWHGPLKKGYHIDHIDGNKENNHADNLRQVTPFENVHNKNTFMKNRDKSAKLTEADVYAIRLAWDTRPKGKTTKTLKNELAQQYNVSAANIEAIGYRKTWNHLTP